MTNRELLKRVIRGGFARQGRLVVYSVCNGVKTYEGKQPIDGNIDITIEVHYKDRNQLELQTGANKFCSNKN